MFHDVFIMFPRFVEENIAWGHASATHAEVEAAAEVGLQVNLQATWTDAMDGSDGSSRLRWLLASLKSCLRCRKAWRFSRSESMSEMPHFTWEFIVSGDDDFSNMRSSLPVLLEKISNSLVRPDSLEIWPCSPGLWHSLCWWQASVRRPAVWVPNMHRVSPWLRQVSDKESPWHELYYETLQLVS